MPNNVLVKSFAPISVINSAKRQLLGVLTLEVADKKNGWVMDFEESVPYFKEWFNEIHNATSGKSWGNVREQHTLNVVGKISEPPIFDYEAKRIIIKTDISDDKAWQKCEDGEYCGYSWSGWKVNPDEKVLDKWSNLPDGANRYVGCPIEVSLTDNPNQPGAYFSVLNSAGKPVYEYIDNSGNSENRVFKTIDGEKEMDEKEIKELVTNAASAVKAEVPELVKNSVTEAVKLAVTESMTEIKTFVSNHVAEQIKSIPASVTKDELQTIVNSAIEESTKSVKADVMGILAKIPAHNVVATAETEAKNVIDFAAIENSAGKKLSEDDRKALALITNFGK